MASWGNVNTATYETRGGSKAAREIQEIARGLFLKRIKDRAGRLPNWELLYAITAEDRWIWPVSEQEVNAKAGWQESHWWGLWGPKRMDE
jgi:hypothetical protein